MVLVGVAGLLFNSIAARMASSQDSAHAKFPHPTALACQPPLAERSKHCIWLISKESSMSASYQFKRKVKGLASQFFKLYKARNGIAGGADKATSV